jgi:hypothetical protein
MGNLSGAAGVLGRGPTAPKTNTLWRRSSHLTMVRGDGDGPCYQADDRRGVIGVAAVAAVASYEHPYALARAHG